MPVVSGQLALVSVQVSPAVLSVQALITVPEALEPIVAPSIGRDPPGSAAITILALSKALVAALLSALSYSSSGSALRRSATARWLPPPASQLRLAVLSLPVVIVPPEFCGAARGWAEIVVVKKPSAKLRGSRPAPRAEKWR